MVRTLFFSEKPPPWGWYGHTRIVYQIFLKKDRGFLQKGSYYSQSASKEVNTSFEACGVERRRRPQRRPRFELHRQSMAHFMCQRALPALKTACRFSSVLTIFAVKACPTGRKWKSGGQRPRGRASAPRGPWPGRGLTQPAKRAEILCCRLLLRIKKTNLTLAFADSPSAGAAPASA